MSGVQQASSGARSASATICPQGVKHRYISNGGQQLLMPGLKCCCEGGKGVCVVRCALCSVRCVGVSVFGVWWLEEAWMGLCFAIEGMGARSGLFCEMHGLMPGPHRPCQAQGRGAGIPIGVGPPWRGGNSPTEDLLTKTGSHSCQLAVYATP